jgi:hypothetical protein
MGKQPPDDVNDMEREIDTLRVRIQDLIGELERRVDGAKETVARVKSGLERARHVTDLPAQHPGATAGVGLGALALIGLGVWGLWRRYAERRRLLPRMKRQAQAYRALVTHPERALATRDPPVGRRLLIAIAITAATTLTRRLLAAKMR